jgi:hypothetical protein
MKVTSLVNLVRKLSGTKWGSGAHTLQTACIALIYSATEYCAPVWLLNNAMRLITGTVKSTTFQGLPVLNNIALLRLRREVQGHRELKNSWSYDRTLLFD